MKPDPEVAKIVNFYQSQLPKDLEEEIALCQESLNSTTEHCRSKGTLKKQWVFLFFIETTMCNLVADAIQNYFKVDLGFANGGLVR